MAVVNRNSAAKARTLDNQIKALELRRMGKGYVEIAAALGIGKSQAHRLVQAGLEDARAQVASDATELRAEEVSRLDAMLAGLWPEARKGSYAAIDRVLKIMERRAKLLGLDAPIKHSATDPTGEIERTNAIWMVPPEMSMDEWTRQAQALVKTH